MYVTFTDTQALPLLTVSPVINVDHRSTVGDMAINITNGFYFYVTIDQAQTLADNINAAINSMGE
jgi:hypothetical protein